MARARKQTKAARGPMAVPLGGKTQQRAPSTRRSLAIRGGVLCLALAAAAVAAWQVPRLFREAERFRLLAVEFYGGRLISGSEVLEVGELGPGDNIYALDLQEVAGRIEALPWIKRARVQRKPPSRLEIAVVERRRLAWLDAGRVLAVDGEGVVLPGERYAEEGRADLNLPLIGGVGLRADSLQIGEPVDSEELRRLLDWWQQAKVYDAELCMSVSEIRPGADGGVRLLLVGDGLEVRLPDDRVKERLTVLRGSLARVYRECPDPAYIDLRFAGQVVVGSRSVVRKES